MSRTRTELIVHADGSSTIQAADPNTLSEADQAAAMRRIGRYADAAERRVADPWHREADARAAAVEAERRAEWESGEYQ